MAEWFVPAPLGPNISNQGGAGALRTLKNAQPSVRSTIDPEFRAMAGSLCEPSAFSTAHASLRSAFATQSIFQMRTKLSFGRAIS
jgi:hypothetical protein